MSRGGPAGLALLVEVLRWTTVVAGLMLALSTYTLLTGSPAGAGGAEGSPVLRPERIETATEPFALVPPEGASCEEDGTGRSGNEGWRWHTFIVEASRDLSTLEFGPFGPGNDYDASDGQITATLITRGSGVWSKAPAEQPKGLIDPGDLGGLVLDPSDYTLRDGQYLVGFACTDEASATRQWWSLEVTVQTGGSPFLSAADAPDQSSEGSTATPAPVADDATPTSTPADGEAADSAAPGVASDEATPSDEAIPSDESVAPADSSTGPAGVSWSPLVSLTGASSALPVGAWAALVLVLARITYLTARPLRVVSPLAP